MIVSRQKSSIERLREQNKKWGMGKLLSHDTREQIVKLRNEGISYRNICKELDVSLGSVQHTLKSIG